MYLQCICACQLLDLLQKCNAETSCADFNENKITDGNRVHNIMISHCHVTLIARQEIIRSESETKRELCEIIETIQLPGIDMIYSVHSL